eukprot:g3134.t1
MFPLDDLKVFLHPDFDADLFSSDLLEKEAQEGNRDGTSSVELCVASLESYLKRIDEDITTLVEANEGPMLERMSRVGVLKRKLELVMRGAHNLKFSMRRIRSDVLAPFAEIKRQSELLRRMQSASSLLRQTMRLLFVIGKLRSQISRLGGVERKVDDADQISAPDLRELCGAAQSLRDIGDIKRAGNLDGIEVAAAELEWVKLADDAVRSKAEASLRSGLRSLNQVEVGSSLQVFFTLGTLAKAMNGAVIHVVAQFRKLCVEALDMSTVGSEAFAHENKATSPTLVRGARNPSPQHASAWRNVFWRRMSRLIEGVYVAALQAWTLYRVAIKKRDPKSHRQFVECLQSSDSEGMLDVEGMLRSFWLRITGIVTQQLKRGADRSQFLRNILIDEYPRARGQLSLLIKRLNTQTSKGSAADRAGVRSSGLPTPILCSTMTDKDTLLGSLAGFLEMYLARSVARLSEPLNFMWPVSSPSSSSRRTNRPFDEESSQILPTANDVSTYATIIDRELQAARRDLGLLMAIARGAVMSSVRQFSARAESATAPAYSDPWVLGKTDPSYRSDGSGGGGGGGHKTVKFSMGQRRNATIFSRLQQLRASLQRQIDASTDRGLLGRALRPAIACLDDLAREIIAPYVLSSAKQIEFVIADMHLETFDAKSASGTTSKFARRLQSSLGRLARFLDSIASCPVQEEMSRLLASRVVVLFVRHASLLRPLSEAGKLRLTQDMAQLELALGQIVKIDTLGRVYEELRSFRQLLFVESEAVSQLPRHELQKMRPSTLVQHLISRAPHELQHPFENEKDAVSYSKWMEVVAKETKERELANGENGSSGALSGLDVLAIFCGAHNAATLEVETAVWKRARRCIDTYAQRMSNDPSKRLCPEYRAISTVGPTALRSFRAQCSTASSAVSASSS